MNTGRCSPIFIDREFGYWVSLVLQILGGDIDGQGFPTDEAVKLVSDKIHKAQDT